MAVGHEKTIGSKGHGLWGIPHAQLPAKIQHVYNDLVESGKPVGGATYRLAVGIVKNWAHGHDGKGNKVSGKVQAEADAAMAEWARLRAKAKARSARKGAKNVSEAKTDRTERAARRLLETLRDPRTSLRNLDRAASLAGGIAGERPRDHDHAAELLEAVLGDCGCGGHAVAEAKAEAKAKPKKDEAEGADTSGDDKLKAEVDKLMKKGMPEKMARKVAQKKLAGKVEEAADEDEAPDRPGHSRLGARLAEAFGYASREWDSIKHPRARGGKFAGTGSGYEAAARDAAKHRSDPPLPTPAPSGYRPPKGTGFAYGDVTGDSRLAPTSDGHSRLAHRNPPTKHSR